MNSSPSKKPFIYSLLIFLALFLFVVCFTSRALWLGDDITYFFHFKSGQVITSVADAFTSQMEHYHVMNGRFLAHFLVQLFLPLWGQTSFALCNGLVYILFLILVLRFSHVPTTSYKSVLSACCLILLGLQTKFTPSCQIGYVWMFTLVLAYLHLFFRRTLVSRWHLVWLIPFSLLAGWSQEGLVVGVSVALIIHAATHIRQLTLQQWVMFFSFGIGAMLLCFSPGSLSRMGEVHGSFDFLPPFVYGLVKLFFYLRVTYLLFFYSLYLLITKRATFHQIYSEGGPFMFHTMAALLLFNIVVGVFGNRQLFGIELMSVIILLRLLSLYLSKPLHLTLLAAALSLAICFTAYRNIVFLNHMHHLYNTVEDKFVHSPDGTVYYDLGKADVTFYETYPCDVLTSHVIGTIQRYFHQIKGYDAGKRLRFLPTCCQQLASLDASHYYFQNAPDSYCIIVAKSHLPREIIQHRTFNIYNLKFPFKPLSVNQEWFLYEDENYRVYQLYDKFPFVKCDKIVFN